MVIHGTEGCAPNDDKLHVARIRALNDRLRCQGLGGQGMISQGLTQLPVGTLPRIVRAIAGFSTFMPDNDPYDEHDFGSVTVDGHKVFWKIDYYDPTLTHGSENPADSKLTERVLTIFLASEY